ncbi:MAG TPA: hypothetical protein EYP79_01775 [Campylobacterales bacterium]|nr:hypothetical protein [Campylobacterales bacterium]
MYALELQKMKLSLFWGPYFTKLRTAAFYQPIRIPKSFVPHPSKVGFVKHLGELRGQLADWRKDIPSVGHVHVVEYADYYLVHKDKASLLSNPIGHLIYDAPHWGIAIILAGALIFKYSNQDRV